jgi:hypothetical protein
LRRHATEQTGRADRRERERDLEKEKENEHLPTPGLGEACWEGGGNDMHDVQ